MRLRGLGGQDVEHGGLGPDVLAGHQGADELHRGLAADTLYGHRGNDALYGGTGLDANYEIFGSDLCRSPSKGPRAHSCEKSVTDDRAADGPGRVAPGGSAVHRRFDRSATC